MMMSMNVPYLKREALAAALDFCTSAHPRRLAPVYGTKDQMVGTGYTVAGLSINDRGYGEHP
jgi:hypothetical protein